MASKKTAVLGASPNPSRYSYLASNMLKEYDHEVLPLGRRKGNINELEILTEWPSDETVDTVTLYMSAKNQESHIDYILGLNPQRIIFNPGAENPALAKKAKEKGIETLNACTLVMLRSGQY